MVAMGDWYLNAVPLSDKGSGDTTNVQDMARARNIKPGFFKNAELAECSPLARLLFIYLWTEADKEGRLEDRPKQLKAYGLPYDDCDADQLLNELHAAGFIKRYEGGGKKIIWIVNFKKHQNPHPKETPSELAEYNEAVEKKFQSRENTASSASYPIPLPLSPIPQPPTQEVRECRFQEFWDVWGPHDRRTDKQQCLAKWKRYGLDEIADQVLDAVRAWQQTHDWKKEGGRFIPAPLVWLNGRRWETPPQVKRNEWEEMLNGVESAF